MKKFIIIVLMACISICSCTKESVCSCTKEEDYNYIKVTIEDFGYHTIADKSIPYHKYSDITASFIFTDKKEGVLTIDYKDIVTIGSKSQQVHETYILTHIYIQDDRRVAFTRNEQEYSWIIL